MVNALTELEVHQLKSLSLNVTELSVSFLDLLARNLPQLEELSLLTTQVVGLCNVCFFPPLLSLNLVLMYTF